MPTIGSSDLVGAAHPTLLFLMRYGLRGDDGVVVPTELGDPPGRTYCIRIVGLVGAAHPTLLFLMRYGMHRNDCIVVPAELGDPPGRPYGGVDLSPFTFHGTSH